MTTQAGGLFDGVDFDDVLKCVHCGLCNESCPTYGALSSEQDSPRGRLYLMRGLWQGDLALDRSTAAALSRCLDCRACETACPSSVPYGSILERARGAIGARLKPGLRQRLAIGALLGVFGSRFRLRVAAWLGWLARRVGLTRSLAWGWAGRLAPAALRRASRLTPRFEPGSFQKRIGGEPAAPLDGQEPMRRVALFAGCVLDVAETEIHRAARLMLRAAGCQVVVPRGQACCGALHVHAGALDAGRALARRNLAAFAAVEVDAIAVDSAGCGAALKDYGRLLGEGGRSVAAKTADIMSILAELDAGRRLRWRSEPMTALYDAPCHLRHAQGVDAPPRDLLQALPGLTLAPLREADRCCGAAGVYNLQHADLADRILDRKLDDIEATLARHPNAQVLLTGNPGCLFQLRYGLEKRGLPLRVMHPVALMAERLDPGYSRL